MKKINSQGKILELKVKNSMNFCTKISFIVLGNMQKDEWPGSVVYDKNKTIPKDERQFWMALRISNNAFFSASDKVRLFLLEVGDSNPDRVVP